MAANFSTDLCELRIVVTAKARLSCECRVTIKNVTKPKRGGFFRRHLMRQERFIADYFVPITLQNVHLTCHLEDEDYGADSLKLMRDMLQKSSSVEACLRSTRGPEFVRSIADLGHSVNEDYFHRAGLEGQLEELDECLDLRYVEECKKEFYESLRVDHEDFAEKEREMLWRTDPNNYSFLLSEPYVATSDGEIIPSNKSARCNIDFKGSFTRDGSYYPVMPRFHSFSENDPMELNFEGTRDDWKSAVKLSEEEYIRVLSCQS